MSYVPAAWIFILITLAVSIFLQVYYTRKSWRQIPCLTHFFVLSALFVCILPFPLLVLDVTSGLHFSAELEARARATPTPAGSSSFQWGSADYATGSGSSTNAPTGSDSLLSDSDTYLKTMKPEYSFLKSWWLVVFLGTQLLAWIILPIAQEYDSSGAFTAGARLKYSLKSNVKLYIILGIVVGILFGYIVFLKGARTLSGIISLGLAGANAFGLILLVIFLSCGLVGVPRNLWRKADPQLKLYSYYYGAVDMQDELDIVKMDLAQLKNEVVAMDPWTTDDEAKRRLAMLLDLIDETVKVVPVFHSTASRNVAIPKREVDITYLNEVSTKVRGTTRLAMRLHYQWTTLIRHCLRLNLIVSGDTSSFGQRTVLYWTKVRKPFLQVLSAFCVLMTVAVLWSETVLPLQGFWHVTLSVAELICSNPNTTFVGSSIFLFYMALAGYSVIFQLKASTLVLIRDYSDAASLCFVTTTLTRLILPLCYNFLWISDLTGAGLHVTYSSIFGRMDVVDLLGPWFNRFLPLGIPILVVLIESKFFDKLMEQAGMDRNDPTDVSKEAVRRKIDEGRQIIELAAKGEGVELRPQSSVVDVPHDPEEEMKKKEDRGKRYAEWKAKRAAAAAAAEGK
jgi:hypothetical protein